MVSLTLTAVGFLVATAVVIALARRSTSRWEQDKRASIAVRADVSARRNSSAGPDPRMPRAIARRGVAALRSKALWLPPVKVLAQRLPKGMTQGMSRVRPIRRLVPELRPSLFGERLRRGRWRRSGSAALPVTGDGADIAVAPRPCGTATDIPSDDVAGAARQKLLRRTVRRAPRRALALLHRSEGTRRARIPREGSDERPPAR